MFLVYQNFEENQFFIFRKLKLYRIHDNVLNLLYLLARMITKIGLN